MEIELSVTFAPGLGEAVRAAAAEAGLSLSEWPAQAAEAKINTDRDTAILKEAILKEAERKRRSEALREFFEEYHAEHALPG